MSLSSSSRRPQWCRSLVVLAITAALTASAAAMPASAAAMPASAAADPVPCQAVDGAWQIDAICADPDFVEVVISSETDVAEPAPHHRISGTIGGSAFNIYLPPSTAWEGRFFQTTYPLQSAEATDEQIAFALDNGAGLVQAAGAAGYRLEAAAVKYAKTAASVYFESDERIYAYLSGGSGGSYPTTGAMENTTGVWDGFVPFITGSPTAIPNNFFARAYARFVLEGKAEQISDAVKPGGNGDPFAGLSPLEASVLHEVTRLGLPLEGWSGLRYILGSDTPDSLLGFSGNIRALDPSYVTEFWTTEGYLGSEDSELGDYFRSQRTAADATIDSIVRDEAGVATALRLSDAPHLDKPWIPMDFSLVNSDGTSVAVTGTLDAGTGVLSLGDNEEEVRARLVEGVTLHIDNSWSLALFAYHRYQTPSDADFHAWDQYRNHDGTPRHPVRSIRLGEVIAGSISGGAAYSGDVKGKVIIVDNLLDVDAYPWAGAWYADRAKSALGERYNEQVRLWYFENSDHVGQDETRVLPYEGVLERAFLDVAAWAEDGRAPAPSTTYTVTDDAQIGVGPDASVRGGIQPSVDLSVAGGDGVEVEVGQPVSFALRTELAPGQGEVVDVAWDFTGSGVYASADIPAEGEGPSHSYPAAGTYFAAARVTVDREGESGGSFAQVMNLDRVRVIVADGEAPVVTLDANPSQPSVGNEWYTEPVMLSVEATDDFDSAPLIESSIDGEGFVPYVGGIEIVAEGVHTVEFRSRDASGKTSETVTWTGKIDTQAPTVAATASTAPRLVTLAAQDEVSGVAQVEYAFIKKSGATVTSWMTYVGPIAVTDPKTVIVYRATDVAGNVSEIGEFTLTTGKPVKTRVDGDVDRGFVRAGTDVEYEVQVDAGATTPVGSVVVRDNGTVIATLDVHVGSDGVVRMTVPNLRWGVHVLTAQFSGTGFISSVSRPDLVFAY